MSVDERWLRQRGVVDEGFRERKVVVAGVGAVGRQVALMLAVMGVKRVLLVDPDVVEEVNVGSQGYHACDVGKNKVDAVMMDVAEWDDGDWGMVWAGRVGKVEVEDLRERDTVFLCVDSMAARKQIWKYCCRMQVGLVVDGRMGGEVVRVVTEWVVKRGVPYEETLYADGDAVQERCTARMTVYGANVCAGLMVHQAVLVGRGMGDAVVRDVALNMLAMEMTDLTSARERGKKVCDA
jgi:threonine dehydrogenase-like Zn-dependent dehydrogenase